MALTAALKGVAALRVGGPDVGSDGGIELIEGREMERLHVLVRKNSENVSDEQSQFQLGNCQLGIWNLLVYNSVKSEQSSLSGI